MATIDKNFRIKHGLIVEGTTGTINGNNILTESSGDSYILNLVGGATLVKSVDVNVFNVDSQGYLTINSNTFDAYGAAATAQSNAESYTDNKIGNTYGKSVAEYVSTYFDASGAAATAQSNAESYTDNQISGLTLVYDPKGAGYTAEQNAKSYADSLASNYDLAGAASTAQSNAESYADELISTEVTNRNNAIATAKSEAISAAEGYADTAVANVVGLAPAALDTLQELAAAFNNQPDTLTNLITTVGTKQDALEAGDGIDLSGPTISVKVTDGLEISGSGKVQISRALVDGWYDAAGSATTAENNAKSYADGLASNYDLAGSAATAESNANSYTDNSISNGNASATPTYQALNIGYYTQQVGNWVQAGTAGSQVTAFEYPTSKGSAEFLVRVMSNTSGHQHSQLSKLLVTTDAAGNVAITEYGIVTTNGTMGDVTADISGGNVRILVTPTYASSEVIVAGTLLAYND